jgi:hypothetical protein
MWGSNDIKNRWCLLYPIHWANDTRSALIPILCRHMIWEWQTLWLFLCAPLFAHDMRMCDHSYVLKTDAVQKITTVENRGRSQNRSAWVELCSQLCLESCGKTLMDNQQSLKWICVPTLIHLEDQNMQLRINIHMNTSGFIWKAKIGEGAWTRMRMWSGNPMKSHCASSC